MAVKRIFLDIATGSLDEVQRFYEILFGLKTVMDHD